MKKEIKSLILFGTIIFIGYMLMAFDLFSVSVNKICLLFKIEKEQNE